jgi:outer membrane protein
MKRIICRSIITAFLVLFSASIVAAADSPLKIGIIDLNKAVNESEQGKKATSELQAMVKEKQQAIDEKGKKFEKLKSELEKKGGVISAQTRKKKEEELSRLGLDYQRTLADFQGELRKKESEVTGRIVADLKKIIESTAREQKYTLILEKNAAVLFSDNSLDITDIVIKKFDESQNTKK